MDRSKTISWVVSVCAVYIRLSQVKTLGVLIAAAMRNQRISLANLGRQMTGNVKHQIKRTWRFCANDGVEVSDAMRGVVDRLVKKRKKPLLADRGFGRTALAEFCRHHGFSYLIRIQPKVIVRLKGFCGKLLDYPVKKGIAKVLKDVAYRSDGAVTQHIVVHWERNLPKKRDECWFLMTDLAGTAHQLCRLYGRRMTIEQLFRDDKSKRNGWSLRDTLITKPERLDRLLLILAIAYLLLCGIGLLAKKEHEPSAWCSTNRQIECSIYTIGMIMLSRIKARPPAALAAVQQLSLEVAEGNWG